MANIDFIEWLEAELRKRSWDISELARRSGLYASTFSRILSRERKAGPEACVGIARALGEPPEKVFRLAGLLPDLPVPEDEKLERELIEAVRQLPPDEREEILWYARKRYERHMER